MSVRTLIVVDLQREFDDKSGNFERILDYVKQAKGRVIATRCINTEDSPFVRYGNWYDCMGSCLPLEFECEKVYDKNGYGLLDYSDFAKEEYEVIGYNTDACVLKIAEDLFDRGYDIIVNTDYCWSSSGEKHHLRGVELMKDLLGTAVI